MPISPRIATGAGMIIAVGIVALLVVHPWHSVAPSTRMAVSPVDGKAPAPAAAPPSPGAAQASAKTADAPALAPSAPPQDRHASVRPSAPAQNSKSGPAVPAPEPSRAPASAGGTPQFDVVRVEPSGDALLAGRGKPNSKVELVDRGRVVEKATTDGVGNFVMTPPALKPGDYALSLREGTSESKQSVTVSVPKTKSQPVVVAMAEPGKPTTLLSPPPVSTPAASAPTPAASTSHAAGPPAASPPATQSHEPGLAIRSVEVENGTGFYATGSASPGADVRLYLNDARIADATANPRGAWSVTVRRGLAAGRYVVRADRIGAQGAVVARVEVPFDVPPPVPPAAVASAGSAKPEPAKTETTKPEPAAAAAAVPTPPITSATPAPAAIATRAEPQVQAPAAAGTPGAVTADVVVERLETELVTRGDNLWRISRHRLGQGTRYTQIYAANAAQIRNPGLIYPGQVFVLPRE